MASDSSARRKPKTQSATRHKIDWEGAAFEWFASEPNRTYQDVATAFNVSRRSVAHHALQGHWLERRNAMLRRAAEKSALRSLEERNRRTLQLVEKARDHLLSDEAEAPKWSDLAPLVKLERLIEDLATENVSVTELNELVELLQAAAAARIPAGEREAFRRDVDAVVVAIESRSRVA